MTNSPASTRKKAKEVSVSLCEADYALYDLQAASMGLSIEQHLSNLLKEALGQQVKSSPVEAPKVSRAKVMTSDEITRLSRDCFAKSMAEDKAASEAAVNSEKGKPKPRQLSKAELNAILRNANEQMAGLG